MVQKLTIMMANNGLKVFSTKHKICRKHSSVNMAAFDV